MKPESNINYCINPECKLRQNPQDLSYCHNCGTVLLIDGKYRLVKPLRPLDPRHHTDIFEVVDDQGTAKVMKVLKDDSPDVVEMFEKEAFTLKRLQKNPGIPQVESDGYFTFTPKNSEVRLSCLVMEKIEGDNLEDWIAKHGSISKAKALNWLKQLIRILDTVHQHHFFHRDIKPSNIMLRPNGELVLIDFGTVRGITATYIPKLQSKQITTSFSGGYTPLEQINGQATPQSDFYALGRTFVYLLTGKHPTDFPTNPKTNQLIWRKQAPHISKALGDFIDELMAPALANRPLNTKGILDYLNPNGLLIKIFLRFVKSPTFKVIIFGLLLLGFIYRLSYPLQGDYYFQEALKAQLADDSEKAKANYAQAIAFTPNDARIYNNWGHICQEQGDNECAESMFKKATELDYYNAVAHYNLGELHEDLGDRKSAIAEYEIAIKLNKNISADAYSNLGRLYILKQQPEKAIELSLVGLKKANNGRVKSALYKNLGWAEWMQINYPQAEAHLREAIKLNEKRTDTYCVLAQVLESENHQQDALSMWNKCLQPDDQNKDINIWRTMAYQRLNNASFHLKYPDE